MAFIKIHTILVNGIQKGVVKCKRLGCYKETSKYFVLELTESVFLNIWSFI